MLLHLKNLLTPAELAKARHLLRDDAPWTSGSRSAGAQALTQKNNQQLVQDSPASRTLQALVLAAVQRDPLFFSATLPRRIFHPLFNRYSGSFNHYGPHIDGAVLRLHDPQEWLRSDLSCTVFLSAPEEYDGGELVLQEFGDEHQVERQIKCPAGDAVLYPGTRVHEVRPVTRGVRLASFFWIESMVRHEEQRRILLDLDMNLLQLRRQLGETPETTALTGVYHNLLRQWAHT